MIIEERGFFWWSDEAIAETQFAPDTAVAGLLKVADDGRISLELDGYLPSEHGAMSTMFPAQLPESKIIRGILKGSGNRVLLFDLIPNGGRFTTNGISYEGYLAMQCLVSNGEFPRDNKPIIFRELEVPLDGFEEWLRLNSIKVKRSKNMISAKYKWPKNAVYSSGDEKLSVVFDISGTSSGAIFGDSFSIKETASLRVRSKQGRSLEDMQSDYGLLEDLFILLTDADFPLDWPWVGVNKKIRYRFYFLRLRTREGANAPKYHECWTNFAQLREDFGKIWSNWKVKREEFGPGFYLYLGTRRGVKLYTEHKFVNLVWGIEALHRKKYAPAASDALVKKIDRIISQVGAARDKKWLRKKLENAHEPSLAQRLFDILSSLPLGLDQSRLRSFTESCAKYRNDISHFGGVRHDGNYSEFIRDLENKSATLSTLYHALLLHEIGVNEKILNWRIYEGFRSYRIKHHFIEAGLLDKSCLEPKVPSQQKHN